MKSIYTLDPNKESDRIFADVVEDFRRKHYGEEYEDKKESEKKAKIESGEWIEVDGKIYDPRYYKGVNNGR